MNDTLLNDRYQLQKQLSKKPGRKVFLAQDLQSQSLVIIKVLLFDPEFQWNDYKLFEREAQTLKNLAHPAIPKYLDYFDVSYNNYHGFALVQAYIDAPSLDLLVQQGRKFSEDELIELADKMLDILDYLHQQNPIVIHRDIKPSNILLANRSGNSIGDLYLVDFGCVQTTASKEQGTITIVGTYGYIPLEQFGGQAVPASDLYSLGMTIVYLATGIHPAELSQVNGHFRFDIFQLSKRLQKWLEKMVESNLNRRFNYAKIAQKALKSKDGIVSNYAEPKPQNTSVQLDYNGDCMEIILPNKFQPNQCYVSILNSMLLLLLGLLCPVPFIFIFFFWFINKIIKIVKQGDTIRRIVINNDKIVAFNMNESVILSNLRSEISLLGYSPSYEFNNFLDETNKQISIGKVSTKSELFVYAGSTKYSIDDLSTPEFWWLGKELSTFLDLELQVIYPTPRVPPESSCGGC